MAKYQKKEKRNIELLQREAMRSKFPNFKYQKDKETLIFTGDLLIKPELPVYNITIRSYKGFTPKVFINKPPLVENAPHTYPDGNICLYYPGDFHWRQGMLIAGKIMQWTIAWIYFYEAWLETGVWFGPEVPHGSAPKELDNNEIEDDK